MNDERNFNEPMVTITLDEFEGLIAEHERLETLIDLIDHINVHNAETYGDSNFGLSADETRTMKLILHYNDNVGGINMALDRYYQRHPDERPKETEK